jgi:hypothetical protein
MVYGAGPDDIWMAGAAGTIIHWDGSGWSGALGLQANSLTSISGSGPDDIWAVGNPGMFHWDGSGWLDVSDPSISPQVVYDIAPDDVWVAGWTTIQTAITTTESVIFHWDGSSWTQTYGDTTDYETFTGIWGSSATNVWVAGQAGLRHWNGSSWPLVWSSSTSAVQGVWGSGPDDVWAVGDEVLHWGGSGWSSVYSPVALLSVWGSGPNDVWAVGQIGSSALHWDGSSWSTFFTLETRNLWGVGGGGPNNAWAVGDAGAILHWVGTGWSQGQNGPSVDLQSIGGSGPGDIWAVGVSSQDPILHWDGSTWSSSSLAIPSGTAFWLNGVWASGPDDAWAVGDEAILHWDGRVWSPESNQSGEWYGVWGSSSDDVWTVGSRGAILHWNGTSWSPSDSGTSDGFASVWGAAPNDVWAVGGAACHWDGTTWSQVPFFGSSNSVIWGSGSTDIWAVGNGIFHWDGRAWSAVPLTPQPSLSGIWGSGPYDVWAVGGSIFHWDGSTWSEVPGIPQLTSSGEPELKGIWGDSSFDVWAVGPYGTILHNPVGGGTVCAAGAPDTNADLENCGSCGDACGSGETCSSGVCVPEQVQWPIPPDVPPGTEYTIVGDGTVTDNITNLIWQEAVPPGVWTWAQAQDYCAHLNLGATLHDWRLPSYMELVSIVSFSGTTTGSTTSVLPDTPANVYWTSSPALRPAATVWSVEFGVSGTTSSAPPDSPFAVRCVTASPGPPVNLRFTVPSTGIVKDNATGLTWEQDVANEKYTWSASDEAGSAQAYCQTLSLGGLSWRLPTVKELLSISDITTQDPTIDIVTFPNTPSDNFWSATQFSSQSTSAWYVSFFSDVPFPTDSGTPAYVRCVSD